MIYTWTQKFEDTRLCGVEADSLEEAMQKRKSGDWAFEDTVSFETIEADCEMTPEEDE